MSTNNSSLKLNFSNQDKENTICQLRKNMLWLSNNMKVNPNWLGIDIRDKFIKEPVCYVCVKDYKGKLHFGHMFKIFYITFSNYFLTIIFL